MFIVRPKHVRTSPTKLAHDLNCQTRFYPNTRHPRKFDYNRDFFMVPVEPALVTNQPVMYSDFYTFATRNKYGQRKVLSAFAPVPGTAASELEAGSLTGERFVVRPLRHSGGVGYRVTQQRLDFVVGQEYISELFPKRREYRVIFVFGQPLIVLRKKPNEGVTDDLPWGHANSVFQTINDVSISRLAGTNAFEKLGAFPVIKTAHIAAADILYNSKAAQKWVVLELNFCPGLDIDANRQLIAEAIKQRNVS